MSARHCEGAQRPKQSPWRRALLALAALVALAPAASAQRAPLIELRPGLVITQSTRIVPQRYRLAAPASLDSAVLVIRGDNLTLQLDGVVLEGQDPAAAPDGAAGVAIRVEGGRNIRVLGGIIRGYKIAIRARGTRGLTLRGIDASYNWKPRLFSLIEHESLLDWLSFHHNEQDEWLRYGAAFYLDGVRGGEVRRNQVVQGMNGLLLVRSDSLRVEENTFSFNSGLGIGLYRSSDNTILRNRLDYNVRGYSHGFYRRGQDSADLLLYEQSSRNLVAYNSATHGGDGLFLWAGQSTMDSGQGGANDNLFYGNDFSFAPANAMEATFSRNSFLANRAEGSDYGLWGGYSYESAVAGNCFRGNRTGIAIEHGQDNRIRGNLFAGDTTAISLWSDPLEPSEWGYPKHRDTQSRDYRIEGNRFLRNRVGVRVRNTTGLLVTANRYDAVDSAEVSSPGPAGATEVSSRGPAGAVAISRSTPRSGRSNREACPARLPLPDEFAHWAPRLSRVPRSAPASLLTRRDRSAIVVDEWGPYDWRSPKLWPVDSSRAIPLRLRTLGPPGAWRVVTRRGITLLSRSEGTVGDTVAVTPARDSAGDWELVLAYTGAATVSPRGTPRPVGASYRFSYAHYEPAAGWAVRAFAWSDSSDVRGDSTVFARLLREPPLLVRQLARLDFEWYRPQLVELPREHWALEAATTVVLPEGTYRLRTISDDGIRVWVDGVLVIDRWSQHESTLDEAPLRGGRHELRVRYFQLDGWTELRVEILRDGSN